MRMGRARTAWLCGLAAVVACSDAASPSGAQRDPLAVEGERVYQNVCIACHHGDPSQDGSLGPAIAGSSRTLLEAKVLRGEYPPDHTPSRDTESMPRFEYLADQLAAIEAYLTESAK